MKITLTFLALVCYGIYGQLDIYTGETVSDLQNRCCLYKNSNLERMDLREDFSYDRWTKVCPNQECLQLFSPTLNRTMEQDCNIFYGIHMAFSKNEWVCAGDFFHEYNGVRHMLDPDYRIHLWFYTNQYFLLRICDTPLCNSNQNASIPDQLGEQCVKKAEEYWSRQQASTTDTATTTGRPPSNDGSASIAVVLFVLVVLFALIIFACLLCS